MNTDDDPRERLLDQAEALFSAKGYRGVTVREITAQAGCNLAAVNYHFRNKLNLYLEVFRERWVPRAKRMQAYVRDSLLICPDPSPEAVARAVAEAFLMGPLSDEERTRHSQLMFREIGRPTKAFELVAKEVMKPFFEELIAKLRPFMPEDIDDEDLLLNILSIFAMVIYFNFARVVVTGMTGRHYDSDFKAKLVGHITAFSVQGLGGNVR
jgi:AcrR family transcriptional regulator